MKHADHSRARGADGHALGFIQLVVAQCWGMQFSPNLKLEVVDERHLLVELLLGHVARVAVVNQEYLARRTGVLKCRVNEADGGDKTARGRSRVSHLRL